jgi:hypothetical protein
VALQPRVLPHALEDVDRQHPGQAEERAMGAGDDEAALESLHVDAPQCVGAMELHAFDRAMPLAGGDVDGVLVQPPVPEEHAGRAMRQHRPFTAREQPSASALFEGQLLPR